MKQSTVNLFCFSIAIFILLYLVVALHEEQEQRMNLIEAKLSYLELNHE